MFKNIFFSLIKLILILKNDIILALPVTTVLISLIIVQVIVIEDGQL